MPLSDDPIQKRGFSPGTSFRVIIYPTSGMIRQAQSHSFKMAQRFPAFECYLQRPCPTRGACLRHSIVTSISRIATVVTGRNTSIPLPRLDHGLCEEIASVESRCLHSKVSVHTERDWESIIDRLTQLLFATNIALCKLSYSFDPSDSSCQLRAQPSALCKTLKV